MRIGLQVPYLTYPGGAGTLGRDLAGIARRAEAAGFDSFWLMDHFFQIPGVGKPEQEMIEGYSGLAYVAGVTERIQLGTMVTGVTYRHPGVLVKTATTLDVLSGGRAYLGIGAAWFEQEHTGLGVPFPPLKERFERLEEALQIAHQMWSENDGPFEGKHYQLAQTLCVPPPVSKPHPPILIGGRGERKTLRFVAKYADAWNMGVGFNDEGVEEFRRLSGVLREHCDREGRPFDHIEKTTLTTLWVSPEGEGRWLSPEAAVDQIARFREAGLDQFIFNLPGVERPEMIEMLAERLVPAVKKL